MRIRQPSLSIALLPLAFSAHAADLSCAGLVPQGASLVCAGFEPNWAIELKCDGDLTSNFTDAFTGTISVTPGEVSVVSRNPWQIETSHPVTGTIAYTPAGCTDESDRVYDFTFSPTGAPGLSAPFHPFCCRLE